MRRKFVQEKKIVIGIKYIKNITGVIPPDGVTVQFSEEDNS